MIELLVKNWKLIAAVALLLAALLYVQTLERKVLKHETTIAQQKADIDTLTSNNQRLQSTIDANNKALELISDGSNGAKLKVDQLQQTIKQQTASINAKLALINSSNQPSTCADAIKSLIANGPGETSD